MPRTVQEIIADATKRPNSQSQGTGNLLRTDIADFFATLPQDADKKEELSKFLNNFAFVDQARRFRILDDIQSYGL